MENIIKKMRGLSLKRVRDDRDSERTTKRMKTDDYVRMNRILAACDRERRQRHGDMMCIE
jgi:hypothetical protein